MKKQLDAWVLLNPDISVHIKAYMWNNVLGLTCQVQVEYRFDGSELERVPLVRKYKLFVLTSVWLVISHSEEKRWYDGWKNPDGCILRLSRSSSQTTVLFIDPPCFTMMPSRVHLCWQGGAEENKAPQLKGFMVKTSRVWLQVIEATTIPQMNFQWRAVAVWLCHLWCPSRDP